MNIGSVSKDPRSVAATRFCHFPAALDAYETAGAKTLFVNGSVERLDETVRHSLAGVNKVQPRVVPARPLLEIWHCKFGAVVGDNGLGNTSLRDNTIEHACHPHPGN